MIWRRRQGKGDITDTRSQDNEILRTLQLDGSRAASALGNKRRVLADLGEEVWPLVIMTGWEKFCCLSELELTE